MKKVVLIIIVIISLVFIGANLNSSNMKKVTIGDKVPTFSLLNQDGVLVEINESIGKPMVIYFYPKDDTPGCTKEACKFRDEFENFSDLGALVIGISADSVESHKQFEEKYNLPFTLLADTNNKVRKQFGVPNNLFVIPGRVTYVINKEGIVSYMFNSQFGAEKHIDNTLKKLKEL